METAQSQSPRRSAPTFWGSLEVFSFLFCVATITGFLGRLWWLFELTSHFPPQLGCGLGGLTLIWLAKRRWRMALLCAIFTLINTALVLVVLWHHPKVVAGAGTRFRLAAINVHTSNNRSDLVLGFLQKADADVILLIEVNDRWMEAFKPLSKDYAYSLADPREDNFGIAIFSRQPLINDRVLNLGSTGVPSIATDLTIGGEKVHLLGTHPFPPGTPTDSRLRNEQLRQIAQYVRQQHSLVIVAGDLNSTPWSPYFRDLLRESGLKNTSQGLGLFPSWPCWLKKTLAQDRIFIRYL